MKPKLPKSESPADRPLQWPADQVERWPLDRLIPYARNARAHTDAQVAQLAASIKEWGWTIPVLVDEEGILIAGHGRVLAAQQLELKDVPTMVARGWSDEKKRAYRIADNRLSEVARWDDQLLGLELSELHKFGLNLELVGYTAVELESLLAPESTPASEWTGMPEFTQNSAEAFRTLIVHFKTAEDVTKFTELVGQPIGPKARFIWFPALENYHYVGTQYVADGAEQSIATTTSE